MQMLCMRHCTTAEGFNRRKEPRNSNIAQLNLQRMVATGVCTSKRELPARLYTTPEYQMHQKTQPAVSQLMKCVRKPDSTLEEKHEESIRSKLFERSDLSVIWFLWIFEVVPAVVVETS
ncbi:Oligopeptide transporter OPT superfamily protein [Dorcoceras hygrometricum]|uniref:Oligopeptide transporter OPT superfamily protein n=1 Tax=Dorcoceras hygrometricum TaxID=472368 RepID=A0A2Z7A4Z0_9LAMI|nr:Oligopeptide transporter OPT superfamily protein [Dorcoceras hygrometricum]